MGPGGHKITRSGEYFVKVDARELRIPPEQLLNSDYNRLSDYFDFGTVPHLTLYPSEALKEDEVMHVSDLTTLSPGVLYYLPSGNNVEIIGGADPQFLLNGGAKEVKLPDEIADELRY